MSPDDPRHGSEAGRAAHHRAGQKPCAACTWAHSKANKRREIDKRPAKVPSLGSQRRIRALQAIGYGKRRIALELGYSHNGSIAYMMRSETMLRVTAERVAEVYDRLSMTVPIGHVADRTRRWAARSGFPPPLAWTDIDDPDDVPVGAGYKPRDARDNRNANDVDEAVVGRLLDGKQVDSTAAEKREAMRRWLAAGKSERSLCVMHSWKFGRYTPRDEGAA